MIKNFAFMGIEVDHDKNEAAKGECIISSERSSALVASIPTDEELMIAIDTMRLTQKQ